MNSELVKHLTSESLLLDKQYDFCFSVLTADVLKVNSERGFQTLHENGEARARYFGYFEDN